MSRAQEVRDSVTMWDALEILEIEYERTGDDAFIHAWDREENTPSVHVEETVWYDFGSGKGGDVFAFVQSYLECSFGQALAILSRAAGANITAGRGPVQRKAKPEPINLADRVLRESVPLGRGQGAWLGEVLHVRHGIWEAMAHKWGLREGPGEALWIPHWRPCPNPDDEDPLMECNMVKVRDYRADRRQNIKGSQATGFYVNVDQWEELCRWDSFNERWVTANSIIITEGESDAWAALELWPGRVACGLPSGAAKWDLDWLPVGYDEAFICLDNDAAGQSAAERMVASVPRATIIRVPEPYNDLNEAWQAGVGAEDIR